MTVELAEGQLYIETAKLAALIKWPPRRVQRSLARIGAAVKRGGRWVTTRHLLREAWPESWDELRDHLADLEEPA